MLKTNYHTHTNFCDGKASPEQMVLSAIDRNFDILGFSSHSMYPFSSDWHMNAHRFGEYAECIRTLKEKYASQIEIYTGFEADYVQGVSLPDMDRYRELGADYLIGAVHYVTDPRGKGYLEADGDFNSVRQKTRNVFRGNAREVVGRYFECQKEMLRKGSFTFLAHPDLIRKQNSAKNPTSPFFDEEEGWYKRELKSMAREIAASGVCIEVNTGGMARGYLNSPYPSPYFMSLLHSMNVPVTLNSDSHAPETLDYWFPEGLKYIKKAGYTELMFYRSGKLESQIIQQ